MDKMNIVRVKPLFHMLTFTMEKLEENNEKKKDQFEEDIEKYVYQISHSSNRLQAIDFRAHALEFIDQWRLKRLEQLDQRIRSAGQLILNAFDEYQNKRQHLKCPHRVKKSLASSHEQSSALSSVTTIPSPSINQSVNPVSQASSPTTTDSLENQHHSQKIELSINKLKSSSSATAANKKISFNLIDFGRDFTFEILAHLSSTSPDIAMTICENNTLVYSQHSNELVILSLTNPKCPTTNKQLKKTNSIIRDLCYIDWLVKCLVITDEEIYLFDYRATQCDLIDSGIGYLCGAIDNHRHIFYLVKQSTLYKYDQNSLINFQPEQYPIANDYHVQRSILDYQSNDYLALLVGSNEKKNLILVYSTKSLDQGYLYKIVIDDCIERQWICSNGNNGWLIRGSYPGSCFDLNVNGLASVRVFDCNEIRNLILTNDHQRFIIRTQTEIFVLIKTSFIHSF